LESRLAASLVWRALRDANHPVFRDELLRLSKVEDMETMLHAISWMRGKGVLILFVHEGGMETRIVLGDPVQPSVD
jgi:hypothetical protein